MATMHEIDFKIFGDDMQFVEVELDPLEAAVAEAGGMMYMEDGIEMETIFGDGSQQNSGFLGALIGAGKRVLIGESMFMTVFQNRGQGKKRVAFGAPYPGKIIPVRLPDVGGRVAGAKRCLSVRGQRREFGDRFYETVWRRPVRGRGLYSRAVARRWPGIYSRRGRDL
jgi:uncharacterized protein (AIM24 family)